MTIPSFPPPSAARREARADTTEANRVRAAMATHYDAVWRFVRHLGVVSGDVEDAVQKVFLVFARRVTSVELGAERLFLFATAVRVASDARRQRARSRESLADANDEAIDAIDPAPSVEQTIDDQRLRRMLDEVLDTLSEAHREVLVLVDIEEQTMADASEVLGIPKGTVASRLRRARELFEEAANTLKSKLEKEV